jgi:hypothetical protein
VWQIGASPSSNGAKTRLGLVFPAWPWRLFPIYQEGSGLIMHDPDHNVQGYPKKGSLSAIFRRWQFKKERRPVEVPVRLTASGGRDIYFLFG